MPNCTFIANQGLWRGGGVFSEACRATVTNSIFWGDGRMNRTSCEQTAQIAGGSSLVFNYCCIQGWTGSLGGEGNLGGDPLFADADGPDNVTGTPDDDLQLPAPSPCLDAGDNTAVPPEVVTDLRDKPRLVNGIVDPGACEFGEAGSATIP